MSSDLGNGGGVWKRVEGLGPSTAGARCGVGGCGGSSSEPGKCDGPAAGCAGSSAGSSSKLVGVHGASPDESDAGSDSESMPMPGGTVCEYEGGRKVFADVSWDGP